ncbi:RNA-directed DNA polymerase, eukaryota, reverse transcriptase zinc-binding domain protein [Tanacetum coccineum]
MIRIVERENREGKLRELDSLLVNVLVPSCFVIYDLEPLSLSFYFVFASEIFKSLSFRLDRLCHLAILCLDQHAHTLHHLESLLTISLDRLDILEGRSCISEFFEHEHVIQRISLTGFPAQSVGSSNTDVLDLPCLLVLITGTSQSRQHEKPEWHCLRQVSIEDAASMVKPVTNEEIKCALFDIFDSKALGPDGYTSKFYKKAWSIIGDDVCSAVKAFFLKGKMLGEINATLITLVPKLSTPMKVSDYRPIACWNVLYKIISKMLINKIKSALCKIVSPCQSAFILGRQITDNILLTQELLRGYNWKNGPKRVAMKIDIQKAYDTVDWDFLEEVLKEFNFPKEMVHWVMVCVRTAAFSICVNGERREINEESGFKYHWGCKELEISHLCFADDLLVVCHGDVKSVKVIKKAMDKFSNMSGLVPNLGKSTVFFGNVDDRTKAEILDILPFNIGKLPVSYLGVPLITKKIGVKEYKSLVDKVKAKVNNWKIGHCLMLEDYNLWLLFLHLCKYIGHLCLSSLKQW